MNTEKFLCFLLCGLLFSVYSGYGLTCYQCDDSLGDKCQKENRPLPSVKCAPDQDKCFAVGYDILGDSVFIASGFKRGCTSDDGYCHYVMNATDYLLRNLTDGDSTIKQNDCFTCIEDFCN
ncbi:hypothetical protein HHI36_015558 [Cryptolaemus montrouzieri]|uniref:Sodefrin-like factor n=1 Tax=Cryptolaemus montrouzieri TaxID=559131 RepID=A0ABD2N788_9CUCU